MAEIGIRELKARASEIIRTLREDQARYTVTYHGKPVAVILPIEPPARPEWLQESGGAWEELVALGEEIAAGWQAEKTGLDLLSDMRR